MSALRARLERFVGWMALAPAGRALADRVLTIDPENRAGWLASQPGGTGFHTLHALLDIACEHLDDAPAESLALTGLVLTLIDREPAGPFRGQFREHLRGGAWRERGNALRMTGELLASCRAYETAAGIFAADGLAQVELAASKRGEAFVRHQLGESDAALEMLRKTTMIFAAHADAAGVARCRLYEGAIHFESDRYDAAAAEFEKALQLATRLDDRLTIARLHLNLGNCSLERGDRTAALRYFARALEFFNRAGMIADGKRVAWAMAQMLADDGFVDRAIRSLEDVAQQMETAGLHVDAALARRDIVEVLVLADRHERAAVLARGVLEAFAKAGLFQEALWTAILLGHAESGESLGGNQS